MLLQFGVVCGAYVKKLELDIRYREVRLNYLEDLLSEELLPNLEELTLKGKGLLVKVLLTRARAVC